MTAAGCSTSLGTARRWVWQLDIWLPEMCLAWSQQQKGRDKDPSRTGSQKREYRALVRARWDFCFWRATSIPQRPNQGDLSPLAPRWRFAGNCRLAMSSAGFSSVTSDSWQRRRSVVPAPPRKPRTRNTPPLNLLSSTSAFHHPPQSFCFSIPSWLMKLLMSLRLRSLLRPLFRKSVCHVSSFLSSVWLARTEADHSAVS